MTEIPAPEGSSERQEERATALSIARCIVATSVVLAVCAWAMGGWPFVALMLAQGVAWQAGVSIYLITFPGNVTAVRRLLAALSRADGGDR